MIKKESLFQGEVKFLTGGIVRELPLPKPAERLIRCDS